MNLTFFGTSGSIQAAFSSNTSFLVTVDGNSILVDVSGSPEEYLRRSGLSCSDLDIIILTHAHVDHLYALPSLLHQMWLLQRSKPLTILAHPTTAQKAKMLCEVFELWNRDWLCAIQWRMLEDESLLLNPSLRLKLFPVEHGIPTIGVKFSHSHGTLVYSSDTEPSERVLREAQGAQWLIHEVGSGTQTQKSKGHTTVMQAAELAEQAAVRTLFLCHINYHVETPHQILATAQAHFKGKAIIPGQDELYLLTDSTEHVNNRNALES